MSEIFQTLDCVIDELSNQGWALSKSYNKFGEFEVITIDDGSLISYPRPLFSPLFRGQPGWFNPCLSSIYRGNPSTIDTLISKVMVNEFESLLHTHPQVQQDLKDGYKVDFIGLAQHYGFKTDYLDLTNSLPVAAFFATNEYREYDDSFIPITDSSKVGVLYFMTPIPQLSLNSEKNIYPIGFQPFRRPAEQRAFYIRLPDGSDLNQVKGVFPFKFFQEKEISERLNEIMEGGKALFPYDIIAVKAKEIRSNYKLSKQALLKTFKELPLYQDYTILESVLIERGYKVVDEEIYSFTPEEIRISLLRFNSNLGANRFSTRLVYNPDNINSNK